MDSELHVVIEEHYNWLYAWNRETNKFLGQSDTVKGLMQRIAEDIDDGESVVLRISREDGGEILQKRAKIELEMENTNAKAMVLNGSDTAENA